MNVGHGRTALITGATRGIGLAIATRLAGDGYRVAVAARNAERAADVAGKCGPESIPVRLDVGDEYSCREAVAVCEQTWGRLDVLVNNAGVAESSKFADTSTEMWRHTMAVDVDGPFWLMRAALAGMASRRSGAVVTIASVAAKVGLPYVAAYTAAKHAVLGLTRSVAAEYARSGVTVNCICPWYVDTDMVTETVGNIVAKTGRTTGEAVAPLLTPQGRLVTVDEVAAACSFLVSPEAASITGQAIHIDGGRAQA
jgi:NAD(P)-dependent dehydrogenase (short-subunit alcohol dehydrogenase family)